MRLRRPVPEPIKVEGTDWTAQPPLRRWDLLRAQFGASVACCAMAQANAVHWRVVWAICAVLWVFQMIFVEWDHRLDLRGFERLRERLAPLRYRLVVDHYPGRSCVEMPLVECRTVVELRREMGVDGGRVEVLVDGEWRECPDCFEPKEGL